MPGVTTVTAVIVVTAPPRSVEVATSVDVVSGPVAVSEEVNIDVEVVDVSGSDDRDSQG